MFGDEGDDEAVGYRRPPKYTRFQPGKSGNPRGRPRTKQPDLSAPLERPKSAALLKVGAQKLPGKIAGKNQQITYYEAIAQKQAAMAIGGNHNAQRDFLIAHRKAEQDQAEYLARKQAEQARDFDETKEWRLSLYKKWAEAEKRGCEPEDPWPHPDDILLDYGNMTSKIRGPLYERQVRYFEMLLAERDLLIVDEAIAWCGPEPAQECDAKSRIYRLQWLLYDRLLPLRWQISEEQDKRQMTWLLLQPTRRLRSIRKDCEQYAIEMRRHDLPWTKESYAAANRALKPLLRKFGYRSLAHLESKHAS